MNYELRIQQLDNATYNIDNIFVAHSVLSGFKIITNVIVMTKIGFKISLVLLFLTGVLSAQTLKDSPFDKLLPKAKSNSLTMPPGYMYYQPKQKSIATDTFPIKYDLRTLDMLTSVKNQQSCGCCWAFASMAAVESHFLLKNIGSYDLSEENMRKCHGFDEGSCTGGNHMMSAVYMLRQSGPGDEYEEVYNPYLRACVDTVSVVHPVTDVRIYKGVDISAIKAAIQSYGALYANMYFDTPYFNSADNKYYYSGHKEVNHAVALVGWDNSLADANSSGYWIAKNSYGETWGENGYFYLSYQDAAALESVCAYSFNNQFSNKALAMGYDELGLTGSTGYGSETAYALQRFNFSDTVLLQGVGTWINTENARVDIEVYTEKGNQYLYNCVATGTINADVPGFYSLRLNDKLLFNKGEQLYLKVKYHTPGYTYPIPVEKEIAGYASPKIEDQVAWISPEGENWQAIGQSVEGSEKDLCLKLFYLPIEEAALESGNQIELILNPASGVINIYFNYEQPDNIMLDVVDIQGKLIESLNISKQEGVLMYRYKGKPGKGMYLLNITGTEHKKVFKLVNVF